MNTRKHLCRLMRLFSLASAVSCLAVAGLARADIFRWDNGQLIPGTEGITPRPWVNLSSPMGEWSSPQRNLRFADFWGGGPGLDLTEASFSGSWLDDSRFNGANLTNASLESAILTNADLSGTNLTDGTIVSGAVVAGADFSRIFIIWGGFAGSGITLPQLYSTASYQQRDLRGIGLKWNDLTGGDFSGQDLTGADLGYSTLTNANFAGAVVAGANFAESGITLPQLYSTASYQQRDLRGIGLISNDLTGADFSGQDLTDAELGNLTNANVTGAVITGANFYGATKEQLYSTASYQQKNLRGIGLSLNDLTGWDFSGQDLTDAELGNLTNANVTGAVITGASFYGATKEQLYSTASYQQKNLRGIGLSLNDLTGWDFNGQDLTGADLGGSTLTNANLSETNLAGADFFLSTLTNANLAGAMVTGASFAGVTGFTKEQLYSTANYQQKDLRGIGLTSDNLSGWDFSGQDLRNANFSGSRLTNANLSGANLTDASFWRSTLTNANLAGAMVTLANFDSVEGLSKEQFYSTANYQQKNLQYIYLTRDNLSGWDFSGQDLYGANFEGSTLTNANLSGTNLTGASLNGATLTNANLAGAKVTGANFHATTSRGFTKEQLYSTASYQQRNLRGIGLSGINLTGGDFSGQDLTGAALYDSTLTNANFSFADLRGASMPSEPIQLARNTIRESGVINGLQLQAGEKLVAYAGVAIPVHISGGFLIAPGATFDLTDNAAIVEYAGTSTAAMVREQLLTGRGGEGLEGKWIGTGIISSTAAAANGAQPDSRSLGYADNAALPLGAYTSFHGAAVDKAAVLIAYTRTGDANLDGVVNDDDVTILGATYSPGVPQPSWALGDFDYNGFVDDDDMTLLNAFYDPSAAPISVALPSGATNVATVPEPTSIALASLGILVLFCHCKRGRVLATILAALVLALPGAIAYGQGQILERGFVHGQLQRDYTLYVPSNYDPQAALPLVVNMHPYGSNRREQRLGSAMNAVAEREGFLVAYPDAVNGDWFGGQDNVGFIDRVIGEVSSQYSVNASQVFATGFSQGGMMSYILSAQRPYTFAAIAPVAGTYNVNPTRPTPLLHIHGTADTFVSYSLVDPLIRKFVTRNGGDLTPSITDLPDINTSDRTTVQLHTYGGGNYLDNAGKPHEAEVLLYRIQNGGHNWPGDYVGWPDTNAPVNYDISASNEIWNFFSRHEVAAIPDPPGWKLDADGVWSQAANWKVSVPNATGAQALFVGAATSPRTVAVDVPVTVGLINLDSPNRYTIAGPNAITLDVASGDAAINVRNGSHVISAPVTLADNTIVTLATLNSNLLFSGGLSGTGAFLKVGSGGLTTSTIRLPRLLLNEGTLTLQEDGGISVLGALTLSASPTARAKLDLGNNAVIVDYTGTSPAATLRQQIIAGRGGSGLGKPWNGMGITSSTAEKANVANPESGSVGYAENSSMPLGPLTALRGQPVDSTSIFLAFTRTGDANLDGVVNDDDVTIVGAAYAPGVPQPSWALGDFDYNGFVDDDDVTLLNALYDPSAPPLAAAIPATSTAVTAIPEPSSASLAVMVLAFAAVLTFAAHLRSSR